MISNFQKQSRKEDLKILTYIIIGFLFVAWLCTPPGNKFLQVCFWGNNTKYFIAKIFNKEATKEYLFYRNNAVYLAKMYPNKNTAILEMDKAIKSLPIYASETELKSLYKDRAYIKLFLGEHKGALNDFINSGNINFQDNLKVAMLFKEAGNYRQAVFYCNAILNIDSTAYSGYACLADIYAEIGRPDASIRIWNLAIDKKPNNPRAYVDRALLKQKIGDIQGYEADIAKAKGLLPTINLNESLIKEALNPKILTLPIRQS